MDTPEQDRRANTRTFLRSLEQRMDMAEADTHAAEIDTVLEEVYGSCGDRISGLVADMLRMWRGMKVPYRLVVRLAREASSDPRMASPWPSRTPEGMSFEFLRSLYAEVEG